MKGLSKIQKQNKTPTHRHTTVWLLLEGKRLRGGRMEERGINGDRGKTFSS